MATKRWNWNSQTKANHLRTKVINFCTCKISFLIEFLEDQSKFLVGYFEEVKALGGKKMPVNHYQSLSLP